MKDLAVAALVFGVLWAGEDGWRSYVGCALLGVFVSIVWERKR